MNENDWNCKRNSWMRVVKIEIYRNKLEKKRKKKFFRLKYSYNGNYKSHFLSLLNILKIFHTFVIILQTEVNIL